ncbi:hypothetical protein BC567DRAFT_213530 [Phyllosticta citribraziliensis]
MVDHAIKLNKRAPVSRFSYRIARGKSSLLNVANAKFWIGNGSQDETSRRVLQKLKLPQVERQGSPLNFAFECAANGAPTADIDVLSIAAGISLIHFIYTKNYGFSLKVSPPSPSALAVNTNSRTNLTRSDLILLTTGLSPLRRFSHHDTTIIDPILTFASAFACAAVCRNAKDKILAGDIAAPVYCIECLIASYHQAANRLAQRNITRERNPVGPLHKSLVEKVREKVMDIGNLQLLQDNRADWEDSRATKMAARRPQGAALKKVVFADDDIVLARHQSLLDEPTTEEYSNENEETGDMSARSNSPCAGPSV